MEVVSREKKELLKIIFTQTKKRGAIEKTEGVIETYHEGSQKL